MKQVHPSYSFVASTKTITLTGLNIDQDQLLLIVNATRGVQYFNFADSSLRATVTAGANTTVVLTDASTTGHANGDALVIYYDDQVTSQVVSGTVTANPGTGAFTVSGTVGLDNASLVALENITVTVGSSVALAAGSAQIGSVTVNNFPPTQTIAGTVTIQTDLTTGGNEPCVVLGYSTPGGMTRVNYLSGLPIQATTTVPVSGTVTANPAGVQTISGTVTANLSSDVTLYGIDQNDLVANVLNGGGIPVYPRDNTSLNGSFPISGTVTAAAPNGSLTTRFGTPTTANTAFATSAVTNANRKYLLIQNVTTGSNVITVGIGFTPTTTQGIQLTAGAGITFESSYIPTGAVYVLSSVTASNFTILEG